MHAFTPRPTEHTGLALHEGKLLLFELEQGANAFPSLLTKRFVARAPLLVAGLPESLKLVGLLPHQADELQALWKTGDKQRGARNESLRQEAWKGIGALLQLEKK